MKKDKPLPKVEVEASSGGVGVEGDRGVREMHECLLVKVVVGYVVCTPTP